MISKSAGNTVGKLATAIGILVILWMTFSHLLPESYAVLRNTLHMNMVIVVGTLSIFLSGVIISRFTKRTGVLTK
jgi:SSS family solute:Na+ symporter